MITFRYAIKENLLPLVKENIVNYGSDYLIGYMEEGIAGQLKHVSLYLVCEMAEPNNSMIIYQNPIAIVARNNTEAVRVFYELTQKDNGTVLCEIENRCDNLVVEPLE